MNKYQSTIQQPAEVSGVGLHTGQEASLTFKPAPADHGIKFKRVDLEEQPIIDADVDNVVDVSRGTMLGKDNVQVGTVEHVMAAIAGLQLDNILVELDAPETPIKDGSSDPFVEALQNAGIQFQDKERKYFEVPRNIHYGEQEREVEMIAMPLDGYRATVMVDYNSPVLGSQHASISNITEFPTEIASSRTFCFLHELEELLKHNLIKGGNLSNAIVIVDKEVNEAQLEELSLAFDKPGIQVKEKGILNNLELRHQNEPARHKLLDLIGDLALIGVPLKAQVMAARPGHAANIEFAKKIKRVMHKSKRENIAPQNDPNKKPVYNSREIEQILPHSHPFIFVDKIIELSNNSIVGVKNVTVDEAFFRGHFPDNPVMPGVIQIESMAQVGGVLILSNMEEPDKYDTYFMKIENAKFKERVVPGDTLIISMETTEPMKRGICKMKGKAFVGDKMVAEAELMAQIIKKQ